jgi:uncharacterized protein YggL (DUF469 family)
MNRAKLIKRGATPAPKNSAQTATERSTTRMAVKVVKAWLTERRATQIEARQAFDALFNWPQLNLPDSN